MDSIIICVCQIEDPFDLKRGDMPGFEFGLLYLGRFGFIITVLKLSFPHFQSEKSC